MEEKAVIDTYAILAMAYGTLSERARDVMLKVREGRVEGLIPTTVAYELAVHWLRGRLPALKSMDELRTFLTSYFKVVELSLDDCLESARVKSEGDKLVSSMGRRLSFVDSTVIHVAKKLRAVIVSGDKDLTAVAESMGVEVVW